MAQLLFWLFVFIVVHTWVGYPIILWIRKSLTKPKVNFDIENITNFPKVSVIVPVYNGEKFVVQKINNLLSSQYPQELLEVIIVSDGSTDQTHQLVFPLLKENLKLKKLDRVGKSEAQNQAIKVATGTIVVFTDVETKFSKDTLTNLIQPFQSDKIGCVTGKLNWFNLGDSAVSGGGGVYWTYEKTLWKMENYLGVLAWGSGACLAVRKSLIKPLPPHYGEDCIIPLDTIEQGYLVYYQSHAEAFDSWANDLSSEFNARIRMTMRSFSGTLSKKSLINPIKYPFYAYAIWSHKLFRWLTPFFLLLILFFCTLLIKSSPIYLILAIMQYSVYILGLIGLSFSYYYRDIPVLSHIGSLLLVQISFAKGVWLALTNKKTDTYR